MTTLTLNMMAPINAATSPSKSPDTTSPALYSETTVSVSLHS